MLWIDWAILGTVFASMLISIWRGFMHEAIALLGWVAAFVLARLFHESLTQYLSNAIQPQDARRAIAWVGVFLVVLLIAHLLGWLARKCIAQTPLAVPDRLLGMGFGFLRGLALCAALVVIAKAFTRLPDQMWWHDSRLIGPLQSAGHWFLDVWHNNAASVTDSVRNGL